VGVWGRLQRWAVDSLGALRCCFKCIAACSYCLCQATQARSQGLEERHTADGRTSHSTHQVGDVGAQKHSTRVFLGRDLTVFQSLLFHLHHVRYVPRTLSMCRFELVGRLILKFQRQHDLPPSFELCDDPRPCRRTKPTKCFMKSSCPWPASSRPSGRKHEYDHQEQETRKHRSTNMFRPRNGLC
jgi:hypothetical protein